MQFETIFTLVECSIRRSNYVNTAIYLSKGIMKAYAEDMEPVGLALGEAERRWDVYGDAEAALEWVETARQEFFHHIGVEA